MEAFDGLRKELCIRDLVLAAFVDRVESATHFLGFFVCWIRVGNFICKIFVQKVIDANAWERLLVLKLVCQLFDIQLTQDITSHHFRHWYCSLRTLLRNFKVLCHIADEAISYCHAAIFTTNELSLHDAVLERTWNVHSV